MEAVREIIDAELLMPVMSLPKYMQNLKVEVIVLPMFKQEETTSRTTKDMKGFLKKYANPALIEQEKNAWNIHVIEKYGNF